MPGENCCYRGTLNCVEGILLKPIASQLCKTAPEVIKWDDQSNGYPRSDKPEQYTAVFAGSFNPPHVGHLAILEYLASRYPLVHAVVGVNPNKTYDVSGQQRLEMLEAEIKSRGLVGRVQVVVHGGLVWKYAQKVGAKVLCRGIRTWEKDGPGEKHLEVQNKFWPVVLGPCAPPMRTVYVESAERYQDVSSTLLRERLQARQPIEDLVGKAAAPLVEKAYGKSPSS